MTFTRSFHFGDHLSDRQDVRTGLPLPIVYENIPVEPARWEYRVLSIDTREDDLPDAVQLNELGSQGWLLIGVLSQGAGRIDPETTRYIKGLLEEGATARSSLVHYYFVRQQKQ